MNTKVFLFITSGLVLFLLGGLVMDRMVQAQQKMKPWSLEDGDWDYWSHYPDMYSIPGGYVGIGTTHPTSELDVVGNVEADSFSINGSPLGEKRVVSGQIIYDSEHLPKDFTNLIMPEMEGVNSTNTVIIASGTKIDEITFFNRTPLAITGEVTSTTSLDLEVWDADGVPYNPASWTGSYGIEINYCVVDR